MRVFGVVSYKGTKFLGWAKQPSVITVQGEIEKMLSQVLNTEILIYGSGRTDAGVHALGQTFTFDMNKDMDLDKLCFSINRMIDKDIKILSLKKVDDDFHARFSAKQKTYRYKIRLGVKDPLRMSINIFIHLILILIYSQKLLNNSKESTVSKTSRAKKKMKTDTLEKYLMLFQRNKITI